MSTLRHPFRAVRERFGAAGVVLAIIALVAALGGTALAARGALTGKQKREVAEIAKRFAGVRGAAGARGAQGKAGTQGEEGPRGEPGAPGAAGPGVTTAHLEPGEMGCAAGGTELISASGIEVICNGERGATGQLTGVAPHGLLMSGQVSFQWAKGTKSTEYPSYAISFPLRLPGGFEEAADIAEEREGFKIVEVPYPSLTPGTVDGCPGSMLEPEADPKTLCIYPNTGWENVEESTIPSAKKVGGSTGVIPSNSGLTLLSALKEPEKEGAHGSLAWAYKVP